MSHNTCRDCKNPFGKCKCITEITTTIRSKYFNDTGQYSSDADILYWWNSLNNASDSSVNNGGSTDYYKFEKSWVECSDIIESRKMNYNQGNIFKSAFCFNTGRHEATNYERELNKIIYFTQRELNNIKG